MVLISVRFFAFDPLLHPFPFAFPPPTHSLLSFPLSLTFSPRDGLFGVLVVHAFVRALRPEFPLSILLLFITLRFA